MKTLKCKQCGNMFLTYKKLSVVCSRICYSQYRSRVYRGKNHSMWKGGVCSQKKICDICRKKFIGHKTRVVCSPKCMGLWQTKYGTKRGKNNGMWNNGTVNGVYILISQPKHPNSNKGGYIAEHRYVMEQKIGRYLKNDEQVHHINLNKHDNRIENLQLMSKEEHDLHHRIERMKKSKGYSFDKDRNLWSVYLQVDKKYVLHRRVKTEEEAKELRKLFIKQYLKTYKQLSTST
jgi:hypothetical protein